jgi:hypothetical protein
MPSPLSRRQSKAQHTGDALHERSFLDHDLRHSKIKAQRGLSVAAERLSVGEATSRRRMARPRPKPESRTKQRVAARAKA